MIKIYKKICIYIIYNKNTKLFPKELLGDISESRLTDGWSFLSDCQLDEEDFIDCDFDDQKKTTYENKHCIDKTKIVDDSRKNLFNFKHLPPLNLNKINTQPIFNQLPPLNFDNSTISNHEIVETDLYSPFNMDKIVKYEESGLPSFPGTFGNMISSSMNHESKKNDQDPDYYIDSLEPKPYNMESMFSQISSGISQTVNTIYNKISTISKQTIEVLNKNFVLSSDRSDNFRKTNDNINPPSDILEKLINLYNSLIDSDEKYISTLDTILPLEVLNEMNNIYNNKLNRTPTNRFCTFKYDCDILMDTLEELIDIYEVLVEDRALLDDVEVFSDEIVTVITEYDQLKKCLDKYDNLANSIKQFETLSRKINEKFNELNDDGLINYLPQNLKCSNLNDCFNRTKINDLRQKLQHKQMKYNYYKRMADTITNKLKFTN